jgi:DNA-binding LacI/PurR family transcriptional regulator
MPAVTQSAPKLRSAQRRPTISDVAKLANVSIATVSRVVNGSAPVADETVQQVWRAIDALNYMPSSAARSLAGRRTGSIGLFLPRTSGAFFASMLHGVETGVRESGFELLIHAHPQVAREAPSAGSLAGLPLGEHNTDGILVFTDCLSDAEIHRLFLRGFPQVLLFRSAPPGVEVPCVNVENKAGARQLVDHLIEVHGRQRIGFLRGPDGNEDTLWRERGYRESLEAHGIPVDPVLVASGCFTDDIAQAAVEDWLRRAVGFDAVFAGDDDAATGVLLALRQAGLRIPEDVSVVGFDDLSYARLIVPSLTTVRAPIETAGLLAARQLISLIQSGTAEMHTLLPTEPVIRQSCGCS